MRNDYILALGYNEDGDQDCRLTVVCDTIQDAREATVYLKERYRLDDVTWEGKGGQLVYTRNYSVCGTSFAIEQSNDRWASAQSDMEPRY